MKKTKKSFEWNKVTPLPKYIAMALFVALPFIGFVLGMKYQKMIDIIPVVSSVPVFLRSSSIVTPKPSNFGSIYSNEKYGFTVKFPIQIKSYEVLEFPWPSHEKAYNPLTEFSFASSKTTFTDGDDFYLDYDHHVKNGDLVTIFIHDQSLCNDNVTDNPEKDFCKYFLNTSKNSGVYKPYAVTQYWVKNDRYIFIYDNEQDIQNPLLEGILVESIVK